MFSVALVCLHKSYNSIAIKFYGGVGGIYSAEKN